MLYQTFMNTKKSDWNSKVIEKNYIGYGFASSEIFLHPKNPTSDSSPSKITIIYLNLKKYIHHIININQSMVSFKFEFHLTLLLVNALNCLMSISLSRSSLATTKVPIFPKKLLKRLKNKVVSSVEANLGCKLPLSEVRGQPLDIQGGGG